MARDKEQAVGVCICVCNCTYAHMYSFISSIYFFKTGFPCIAMTVLELTL